jgi:ribosomal protein L11 methyltransferase
MYKIYFITNYKSVETFEKFFPEDVAGISTYEIESKTIDAQDDDLWSFEVYFTEEQDFDQLQKSLKVYAAENDALITSEITEEFIEDKDWITEYQKQLKPIEIGRFLIIPNAETKRAKVISWLRVYFPGICRLLRLVPKIPFVHFNTGICVISKGQEASDGKIPIIIAASRAFGTGGHATTSLCIKAMELIEDSNIKTIFDVGTGSGILGFVAEKIWPEVRVLACDIEETSVIIAKENAIINKSTAYFYQNSESGLNIPEGQSQTFDLIISNILAKPLIAMAAGFKKISHSNTKVILSGFLDYQQQEVQDAYEAAGFIVEKSLSQDRWVTLVLAASRK